MNLHCMGAFGFRHAKILMTSTCILLTLAGCRDDEKSKDNGTSKAENIGTFQQETQNAKVNQAEVHALPEAADQKPGNRVEVHTVLEAADQNAGTLPVTSTVPIEPPAKAPDVVVVPIEPPRKVPDVVVVPIVPPTKSPDVVVVPIEPKNPPELKPYTFISNPVVSIDPADSLATMMEKAASVTPTVDLYNWQRMELTGFIHFSVNTNYLADMTLVPTYGNNGTGDESAQYFNPTNLNPKVWLQSFKDAGFKQVVITAKHHNGFHLWPATTTDFSVAKSPWKNGTGDVLKEFSDAAKDVGIKIGFYLSPADLYAYRHQKSEVPGSESSTVFANPKRKESACQIPKNTQGIEPNKVFSYSVDEYNCNYMRDLYDLFTKYGTVSELWLDGYDPTGVSQPYSTDKWIDLVNRLQTGVIMFNSYTPNQLLTWVGNEDGKARETLQWSVLPANNVTFPSNMKTFGSTVGRSNEEDVDRGSRGFLQANRGTLKALWWAPSETDMTIAEDNAWFYNPKKATKSLKTLMSAYFTSVGRNTNLILNIGPRADGTMAPDQLDRLKELGTQIKHLYDTKILVSAEADKASAEHPASSAVSDVENVYWTYPPDGLDNVAALTLTLNNGNPTFFNLVVLQEDIRVGQRVETFSLEMWDSVTSTWKVVPNTVGKTGTIGYKRILFLGEPISASKIRLKITKSRLSPAISNVSVYNTSWRDTTISFVN